MPIGRQHGAASLVVHGHGAARVRMKTLRMDLAAIDQREHQPVGHQGPELLHEVQGQRRPAGPVHVQKTHRRIKPDRLQRPAQS